MVMLITQRLNLLLPFNLTTKSEILHYINLIYEHLNAINLDIPGGDTWCGGLMLRVCRAC